MKNGWMTLLAGVVVAAAASAAAQTPSSTYRAPRTADGHPDLPVPVCLGPVGRVRPSPGLDLDRSTILDVDLVECWSRTHEWSHVTSESAAQGHR